MLIGTVQRYPTKADVGRVAESLRFRTKSKNSQGQFDGLTVGGLIDRFIVECAPKRRRRHTQKVFQSLFDNRIRPKWGSELLKNVKSRMVENWPAGRPSVELLRSLVEGEESLTKTDASESPLPLDPDLAELLLAHMRRQGQVADSEFVFAGRSGNPPWPDTILADYLKPAARKAEIGNIGWHTFRHTYSTLLHALGTTPAVQKELLRHADIQTTLNIYTQAIPAAKREAASKVASALWKM